MKATEELCRLLDERGVKHYDMQYSYATEVLWGGDTFGGGGAKFTAYEQTDGFICLEMADLTPEQAIAATLGRGMLTADDVCDLIERHSDAFGGNGRDFHNGAYVTIADELNATLGPGTCKLERASWDNGMCTWGCICSACDAHLEHETGIGYNFCPICDAKVVSK